MIPKNEQELSKLFVLIFPLTLLLSLTISFLKNAYFTFANLLPNNSVFNYGFLDRLDTQAALGLVFGASLCLSFAYLFSKIKIPHFKVYRNINSINKLYFMYKKSLLGKSIDD